MDFSTARRIPQSIPKQKIDLGIFAAVPFVQTTQVAFSALPKASADLDLERRRDTMTVGRFCVREVDLAARDETVQAAAQRMHARKVGTLVVVNQENQPIGIVTDRDLTVKVLAEGKDGTQMTVGDVMTSCPKTVSEQTSLEDALVIMRAAPCRRLPVTDAGGQSCRPAQPG